MARSGCDAASADEANWKDLNRWPVRLRYTLENKASERKSVTMYAIGTKIDSAMMRKRGRPACHSASVYAGATRGGGLRQIDRMQVCFLARGQLPEQLCACLIWRPTRSKVVLVTSHCRARRRNPIHLEAYFTFSPEGSALQRAL